MDPNQQQLLLTSGGATDKIYIDEVYNTKVYVGNATERTITTGIDLAGEGGLLWFKNRDSSNQANYLMDTTALPDTSSPWYSYPLVSNSTNERQASANGLKSFNSDGFTIQTDTHCNGNGNKQIAWSFRKAPAFFDIVQYSGDGTSARDIAHNLGCIPGMIIIKRTDAPSDWYTYHKNLGRATTDWAKILRLNSSGTQLDSQTTLGATSHQNASTFRVGNGNSMNATGGSYVAYLFAGGESRVDTARSVGMTMGAEYLESSSSDYVLGTGDFTVELWFKTYDTGIQRLWDRRTNANPSGGVLSIWNSQLYWHIDGSTGPIIGTTRKIVLNQWYHAAVVRQSGTTKLYLNGELVGTLNNDTTNYDTNVVRLGEAYNGGYGFYGNMSNFRYVVGTAVYTESFKPPTEPLTSITNTKLLCCNNASVTGKTTGATITSNGTVTAYRDNPFDDPESFKFGVNADSQVVKCGSYSGNTTTQPYIDLGWEPQLVIFKQKANQNGNWSLFNNVCGMNMPLEEKYLYPNLENSEYTAERLELTPRGFRIDTSAGTLINTDGEEYIYIAIRRSDAFVGKPAEVGTDVFNAAYGTNTSAASGLPSFASAFKADMRLQKEYNGSQPWYIGTRQRDHRQLHTNGTTAEVTGTYTDFEHSLGEGNNWNSNRIGYLWKRHAGFDVVSYYGNNVEGYQRPHNLGRNPEMIWIKDCTSTYDWMVWHKDLDSGNHLILNSDGAQTTSNTPGLGVVSADTFNIGSYVAVNQNGHEYVAYLWASVPGISKCGTYSGQNTDITIDLGFTPRFFMCKAKTQPQSTYWAVFDSVRGITSGSTPRISLNVSGSQNSGNFVSTTASGITLNTSYYYQNEAGYEYIYYAHA